MLVDKKMNRTKENSKEQGKNFEDFRRNVEYQYTQLQTRKQAEAKISEERKKSGNTGKLYLVFNDDVSEKRTASTKQISYIKGLMESVKRRKCRFSGTIPKILTMRDASACIDFFKTIAYDDSYSNLDFGNIWEVLQSAKQSGKKKVEISFHQI